MAQDALDDILLVDDAKRCAFAGSGEATPVGLSFAQAISLRSIPVSTSGTQRVGLPHLLDQLAPLLGRDAPRLVGRNVDQLHGVALGLRFFVRPLGPPARILLEYHP
jgi:hypothetical protein